MNIRAVYAILCLALAGGSQSETAGERIIAHATRSSVAWDFLAHLTDNIGPRLSGSRQAQAAVSWTTDQLSSWGFDTRNETINVPRWVRGEERASLVSHYDQKIVITALGGSVATPLRGVTAEVIEVASLDELNARGAEARGKIVLFNNPFDMKLVKEGKTFEAYSKAVTYRSSGASHTASAGGVATLVRSVATSSLRTPHTGSLCYVPGIAEIPAAAVSTEDADLIHRLLAKGERVMMHLVLTPRTLPDIPSANVVFEIKGREKPEEVVVIGGHLDSWDLGTGATDNGSGVAMVVGAMRTLQQLELRPRRTIRAVLFMNEENGLRGAYGYFGNVRSQLPNHVAAIESDAGSAAAFSIATTLPQTEIDRRLRPLLAPLQRIGVEKIFWQKNTGADTSPLVDSGVLGFGIVPVSEHYFDLHHASSDTLDKILPQDLANNTAALAYLAWVMAEEPRRMDGK